MTGGRTAASSKETPNVADVLERVLDKGIVIAGDITISLIAVELLTIQIRLVICSVDKAKEIGMDWWAGNPAFMPRARKTAIPGPTTRIEERLERLEEALLAS